ncbi:MAG: exo-alpha-sialidase [Planctomycetes bacterium]|nr:exo-alpha-sialidase [Planctomycetota bacterium]
MSDRVYLATRKGMFTVARGASGWKIDKVDFLGQNANMLVEDPRDGALYVALDHGHFGVKLHRSRDRGQSWQACAVPVYPQLTDDDRRRQAEAGEIGARRDFSSLKEIWELTPGGADQPGTLWAGTIPGALFRSRDYGDSWELIDSLWNRDERWKWFGGGKDSPGIHSVAVNPRNSQEVTVGISCGGAWVTEDGGATWQCRAAGMRAEYMPPEQAGDPNVQDPHRLVQCPAAPEAMWVQHHNGIFRTTDGARSWQEIRPVEPSVFGFAVVVHPHDANTAWFVPGVKDECRVPVQGKLVVTRTRDGGRSFELLTGGLPQEHCYDIVFRHALDVDSSGDRLVMGSSTGSLWISENGGASWTCVANHLPQIYCARFGH